MGTQGSGRAKRREKAPPALTHISERRGGRWGSEEREEGGLWSWADVVLASESKSRTKHVGQHGENRDTRRQGAGTEQEPGAARRHMPLGVNICKPCPTYPPSTE